MNGRKSFWMWVAAACALMAVAMAVFAQTGGTAPIYLDPKQSVEARVEDLMSRMTLKEKVGQLNLPCVYVNELQKIATTQTRLKIPVLEDEEATHGLMNSGGTVFPEGLALGSSFDIPLFKEVYSAVAAEGRAEGIHMLSTLVMEVDRDPRMGRNEEAYTEDPYLYSRLGESIVRATQGSDISAPDKVIAVLTDFPTQSEPAGGLERGAIELSERSLCENFLPPWIAAITSAGGLGVMAG